MWSRMGGQSVILVSRRRLWTRWRIPRRRWRRKRTQTVTTMRTKDCVKKKEIFVDQGTEMDWIYSTSSCIDKVVFQHCQVVFPRRYPILWFLAPGTCLYIIHRT